MSFDQVAIAILGPLAVWLSQEPRLALRRWACIAGLASQPFWFYATWRAAQWGIFAVCGVYALAWARGFWVHWVKAWPIRSRR